MAVTQDRMCSALSVVIGIAGTNFCTLLADGRQMISHSLEDGQTEWSIKSDEFQKVYRLNPRVVIGIAGVFQGEETVLTPLASISDLSAASVRVVCQAYRDFLNRHKMEIFSPRSYIVGGKEKGGRCVLYHITFDPADHSVKVSSYEPQRNGFAVVCALPPSLADKQDYYMDMVKGCITSSHTHEEMAQRVGGVINDIAKVDQWVGGPIFVASVS